MKMTIDTSRFNAAARALSTGSGVPLVRVLEAEATKVLEKAASLTPSAAVAKIRASEAASIATSIAPVARFIGKLMVGSR